MERAIVAAVIVAALAITAWLLMPEPRTLVAVQAEPQVGRDPAPPRAVDPTVQTSGDDHTSLTAVREEIQAFRLSMDPRDFDDHMRAALSGDVEVVKFFLRLAIVCLHPSAAEPMNAICGWMAENGAADPRRWARVAVDAGDMRAAQDFFLVHQRFRDEYDDVEWHAVEAEGRFHLERARDAGRIEAFDAIALFELGALPDGPYPGNLRNALAHLYASELLQQYVEPSPGRPAFDAARLARTRERIAEVEAVIPSQIDAAREIADALLDRCCRRG